MDKYAILIDGGFVKRKLGSAAAPMTSGRLDQFIQRVRAAEALAGMRLHRIYYYDAMPLDTVERKPLNGGKIKFGEQNTALRNHALFRELARLPYFALRMGDLAFRGWKLDARRLRDSQDMIEIRSADLRPEIGQKGVDMRIGLDIASLTLKRQVDVIVLVTGDSDFVPAMKFARKEGSQLFLVPLGHGVREPMVEHSDLILDITTGAS